MTSATDSVPGDTTEGAGEEKAVGGDSRTFTIHSLRPEYDKTNHELYVDYLRAELAKPARKSKDAEEVNEGLRPRNIALTGSYGSGKSSILSKVVDELGDRVVSVSLSTLGNDERSKEDPPESLDPLATPAVTNAIQKEIVKQLLYREKPSNVPGSRYRRIEGFRRGRAFVFSLLVASALTALALLTGATVRVEKIFGNQAWSDILIYVGVFVVVVALAQGLQALFHNRVWIDKLSSGPASISLTNRSESSFDRYLDELVYFFEANAYDVVVFEDIDRFNDPYIFETLRELNTLLNNSKQIEPRLITFVYAIKDSIFEQLGKLSINGIDLTVEETRRLAVTNRTKFFGVVIPVVPFISHRNARDLLGKEMRSSGFKIDKQLLDLVSKHLIDMRLIKNVHNEFGIFERKILGHGRLDELKPQQLFAMVVYKNLNMADFEKIKEGASKLDDLYADFRKLVNQQIATVDHSIRLAQSRTSKLELMELRAKRLGDQLEDYVTRLLRTVGSNIQNAKLTLAAAIEPTAFRQSSFWKSWLDDESQSLSVTYPTTLNLNYYGHQQVSLALSVSLDDLRVEFGDSLSLEDWEAADAKKLQLSVEEKRQLRGFLKGATMMQLLEREDLKLKADNGNESFRAIAERHLGSGLAMDLVTAGYFDRNFSLYVSLYYDDTVTARARNYILHSVESGSVDINAEIGSDPEIAAMIDEVGDTIFAERSIYNIQLLDHLLARGDQRLDRSMRLIAGTAPEDRDIRTAYFSSGAYPEALVARLAPIWPEILEFVIADESVADAKRATLLDEAFGSVSPSVDYKISSNLRDFVQSRYRQMETFIGTKPIDSIDSVVAILKAADVRFESLADLSKNVQGPIVDESLYALTAANLTVALGGDEIFSLDHVRSINKDVFGNLTNNLGKYLEIERGSEATEYTIADYKRFIPILNDIADKDLDEVAGVAEGAASVVVTDLLQLKKEAMAGRRKDRDACAQLRQSERVHRGAWRDRF